MVRAYMHMYFLLHLAHLYRKHKIKTGRFLNMQQCEICGFEGDKPNEFRVGLFMLVIFRGNRAHSILGQEYIHVSGN